MSNSDRHLASGRSERPQMSGGCALWSMCSLSISDIELTNKFEQLGPAASQHHAVIAAVRSGKLVIGTMPVNLQNPAIATQMPGDAIARAATLLNGLAEDVLHDQVSMLEAVCAGDAEKAEKIAMEHVMSFECEVRKVV